MSTDLLQSLRSFYNIPADDFKLLEQELTVKSFRKGEVLVAPGQIQKDLYFVFKGVQMSFYEDKDRMAVIAFTYPFNICAIPESFCFQKPANSFLRCMSDSDLGIISYEKLSVVFDKSQHIERLFRKISETVLSGLIQRHIELHTLTLEEKYRTFCQRSPYLLQLIPHKYIASYLGIDSTNFSKLYNSIKI